MRPADAGLRPRRLGEHRRRPPAGRTGRRLLARRSPRSSTSSPIGRSSRSRTSRAGPATRSGAALAVVPADATEVLVLSGDVPLVTGADLDAVLEARRQDDAAIALASVFAADPAQLGRVVRGEFGTVERIVEAKDATPDELAGNEVNAGIYAFDAAWLRRRIGALTPSADDRRAVPDRPRPPRPRGRPDRQRGRVRGRRPVRRDQRSLAARRRRVEPAGPPQRGPHAQRGDDARPVHGLPRLDRRPRRRTSPSSRTSSCAARRAVGDGSVIGPGSQLIDATIGAGARVWASIVESSVVEDEATVGPFSHLRPGHGRRSRARRSATSPSSRTRSLGAGSQAAPHELPRRRRRSARGSTSAPARSPPTTTGRASTRRPSATARSSASTR